MEWELGPKWKRHDEQVPGQDGEQERIGKNAAMTRNGVGLAKREVSTRQLHFTDLSSKSMDLNVNSTRRSAGDLIRSVTVRQYGVELPR